MPFGDLRVRPGVNTLQTPTLNQAGISDSNLIRFQQGLVQKLGGWARKMSTNMGSVVKSLQPWMDLKNIIRIGVGTTDALKFGSGAAVVDITPQLNELTPVINFSTTQGSRTVTIVDTALAGAVLSAGFDAVFVATDISVGGIIVSGIYQIDTSTVANTYTITLRGIPASTTVAAGGAKATYTTVAGVRSVSVTLADHGLVAGSHYDIYEPTIVGGITLSGVYEVYSVTNSGLFTIYAETATSADTKSEGYPTIASGNAKFYYYIGAGTVPPMRTGGHLLNAVAIGQNALGEGFADTVTGGGLIGKPISPVDWTMAAWGETLIACPRGFPIFIWNASIQTNTAYAIGSGPAFVNGIFIAMPQQMLVAWGCSVGLFGNHPASQIDPLMVRWSDVGNYFSWSPRSTNQAGSFRLPTGSEIRGGIQGPNQAIIWTDVDVYTMQYLGPPLIFGFSKIADGCGLIGPHAACSIQNTIYYMGENAFYMVSSTGSVRSIPCSLFDTVFQDLDDNNRRKCVAGANTLFDEVFFFYPSISGGTGECDKYVKFNVGEFTWDNGELGRSAWIDQSIYGNPMGADPATYLLQEHDVGKDADGEAMVSFYETGYTPVGDGETFVYVDHLIPDMKWATLNSSTPATLEVTLKSQKWSNDPGHMTETLTMTSTTEYLAPRIRGRQVSVRMQSSDMGTWWRNGLSRYRWGPDGRS